MPVALTHSVTAINAEAALADALSEGKDSQRGQASVQLAGAN
jgi:hypothetical protein